MSELKPKQTEPALAEVRPPPEFEKLLQKGHRAIGVFENPADFSHAQRIAKMLVTSQLMPEPFRGEENLGSAVIAVDIALRLKLNPLMVAQQIYIVHGKPSFSSQFMIAVCNSSADFGKIRYDLRTNGEKEMRAGASTVKLDDRVCVAWALEGNQKLPDGISSLAKAKERGLPILEGPPVSIEMAVKEGWYSKAGSKWQTLPDLMLRYRAAAFFVRLYGPELLMGLATVDELEDMAVSEPAFSKPVFKSTEAPQTPPAIEPSPPASVASPPPMSTQPTAEKTLHIESQGLNQAPLPIESLPNPILRLRGLCKESGIKEDALIAFLKSIRSVKDNVCSFEEIQLADQRVLGMACEQWEDLSKMIKEKK